MRLTEVTAIALDKELKRLLDGIVERFNLGYGAWKWDLSRSEVLEFFLLKGLKAFLEEEEGESVKKEGEVTADDKQQ